jgi:hypothetical protein
MKTRKNPLTGKEEYWNQPPGLPGIWMTRGYCDRCSPFLECLGFDALSEEEWQEVENLVAETNRIEAAHKFSTDKKLKRC